MARRKRIRIPGKTYEEQRDNAGRMYEKAYSDWFKKYEAQRRSFEKIKPIEKLLDKYTKLAAEEHKFNEDMEHNRIAVVNQETGWGQ